MCLETRMPPEPVGLTREQPERNRADPPRPRERDHVVTNEPNRFGPLLRPQSAPVRFEANAARTDGDLGEAARWLYGDPVWGELLAREDGGIPVLPELLTPQAARAFEGSERDRGARRGDALARLAAKDAPAAQAELLAAFGEADSTAYLDGLEAALGAEGFARLAGPEIGALLGHRLELSARAGKIDRPSIEAAADFLLDRAARDPEQVARLFETAGPLVRRALLLEVSSRHEEEGVFRRYNEPSPGAMLHRFFEMLPKVERSRVGSSLEGLLPRPSIEALEAGRSWAGRNLPNVTHAAEVATRYWAERADDSIVAQLLGPFAALATEETILASLLTLAAPQLGAGLYGLSPTLARAVAVPATVLAAEGVASDLGLAIIAQDPSTGRTLAPHERLGAILRAGSGILLVGAAAFTFAEGRVAPARSDLKFDRSGYLELQIEGYEGMTVLVPRAMGVPRTAARATPGAPRPTVEPRALSAPRVAGRIAAPIPPPLAQILESKAASAAAVAVGSRIFASEGHKDAVLAGLRAEAAAAARTAFQLHLARTGDSATAMKRATHAANATAKAAMDRLAPAEDAALFERAVEDGSAVRLEPVAEARRAAYLAGETGQRIRLLMPRLVATNEAGVRTLMAAEVEAGRAFERRVKLDKPKPQTMTVWELLDGSVVRLKPAGDSKRPGPTLSGEIKLDPRVRDSSQDGIAFKLDGQGRPVPKNRHQLGPSLKPKNGDQAHALEKIAMSEGHIRLGR